MLIGDVDVHNARGDLCGQLLHVANHRLGDIAIRMTQELHQHVVGTGCVRGHRELVGDAVDSKAISQYLRIPNADAMSCSKELARKEGIFVGITSGATFSGALKVCAEAPQGSTVLCMLPDTGERYLSTPLFADVSVDMTPEEVEISRSTPSGWLDAK